MRETDELVNYDEPRVTTSVPALAEIAQRTQVVVLTHHQHVATIAQDVLGEHVRVHRLEESAAYRDGELVFSSR